MVDQLGERQQLVAFFVVADEVPAVDGVFLAEVQVEVVEWHPPPDPTDGPIADHRPHAVESRRHLPLAVDKPLAKDGVVDAPKADLALSE